MSLKTPVSAYSERAHRLLAQMLRDPKAGFREGQLDCILQCVEKRGRPLVVQNTGWGKSLVYFIATKILREERRGPALLVSPLISLMRNQVEMAKRIGIRAEKFAVGLINRANSCQISLPQTISLRHSLWT